MKPQHILVPASLLLFAADPASALTPMWNPLYSAAVEGSTSNIVPVKHSWFYKCNKYHGVHDRQRCYEMHGLNSNGKRVKSGL